MEIAADLFGTAPSAVTIREETRWLLVTNQRNLLYMLAAGLIMPPIGFGRKYYQDTLACFPGWVPLFAGTVPKQAIEYSVAERNHLLPCIATLDLANLSGKIMALNTDQTVRALDFPAGLTGREQAIFIAAPLPIHWIKTVAFRTKEERTHCEADVCDFSNVSFNDCKRTISTRDFTDTTDLPWPLPTGNLPARSSCLEIPFAVGGMMAILYQMANLGETALKTCWLSFDAEDSVAQSIAEPLLASLAGWLRAGCPPDTPDVSSTLFWIMVEKVARNRLSDDPISARDVVLNHLEWEGHHLGTKMSQALAKLARDLRTMATFSESTMTEIFERHPKTFSRVMALFFLRDKCLELLECTHPLLTEAHSVAAAILFAAREGWLGLPLTLRHDSTVQSAIVHRMAAMAQRLANSDVHLGTPPPRPVPLRELFLPGPKGWSSAQKEASLVLARECKWNCIQTRVSLGKGDYRLVIDTAGAHILLAGEPKTVTTEVAYEPFLAALSNTWVPNKLDRKIRSLLVR